MNLYIDHREKDIKKYFSEHKNVIFENLNIGDIRFEYNSELVLLIERKTIKDLSQSIKSGRYREQKLRILNSNLDKSRILYLIEGQINKSNKTEGIENKTLFSSLINILIRDNLKIFQTINLEDSIYFIDSIYQKLQKNNFAFNNLKQNTELNQEYLSSLKTKKKDNLTPLNCFILQLSQVPGISTFLANQIVQTYPNFKVLLLAFEPDNCEGLKDFLYKNSSGKSVKFGSKRSTTLFNYLYHKI